MSAVRFPINVYIYIYVCFYFVYIINIALICIHIYTCIDIDEGFDYGHYNRLFPKCTSPKMFNIWDGSKPCTPPVHIKIAGK